MKVLSLYQPYATLVVIGAKCVETRSWKPDYRGELYIHASARMPKWCREKLDREGFVDFLHDKVLPLGQVLGRVTLDGMMTTTEWKSSERFNHKEMLFGDYDPRRYAWLLSNPVPLDVPLPAKGSLGIWDWNGQPDPTMQPQFFAPNTSAPLPLVQVNRLGTQSLIDWKGGEE